MHKTFVVADTHFSKFDAGWGSYEIIKRWNDKVRTNDTVIHLGDVAWSSSSLSLLDKLNGNKILILGNHDTHRVETYRHYFQDIYQYYRIDNILFSHAPVVWPTHYDTDLPYLSLFRQYQHHIVGTEIIDTWQYMGFEKIKCTLNKTPPYLSNWRVLTDDVTLNIHGHFHLYGRSVFQMNKYPYTIYEEPHLHSRWGYFTAGRIPVNLKSIRKHHKKLQKEYITKTPIPKKIGPEYIV